MWIVLCRRQVGVSSLIRVAVKVILRRSHRKLPERPPVEIGGAAVRGVGAEVHVRPKMLALGQLLVETKTSVRPHKVIQNDEYAIMKEEAVREDY